MNETPFTAGNILSSSAVNLQLFRVCFPYSLHCCYANYCFLSFFSHLVEFQVLAYLSLDIVETFWAVRPNQYHCTSDTIA